MDKSKNRKYLKTLSILLVEDDETTQTEIGLFLENIFKDVHYAKNGEEGIDLFKSKHIDMVLSDVHMPKKDGIAMSKEILKHRPNTPIVIFSGLEDMASLCILMNLGVRHFIQKPLSIISIYKKLLEASKLLIITRENESTAYILEQYQKVINSSSIYSKTDRYGIITYANEAFCSISGYSVDELIGKSHGIIRHPENPDSIYKDMWQTIRKGKIWKGIVKNRNKNGESYTVDSTIIPITDVNGKIIEYISIRHDITDIANKQHHLLDIALENEKIAKQRSKDYIELLHHDENTGLLNILSLREDISSYKDGMLVLLDINNFNIYNLTPRHIWHRYSLSL